MRPSEGRSRLGATRALSLYTQLLHWLKFVCLWLLHSLVGMPSAQETAKRALVQLLRTQGREYGVEVTVTREGFLLV